MGFVLPPVTEVLNELGGVTPEGYPVGSYGYSIDNGGTGAGLPHIPPISSVPPYTDYQVN